MSSKVLIASTDHSHLTTMKLNLEIQIHQSSTGKQVN